MAINTFTISVGLEEVQYNLLSYGGSQGFKFYLRLFIEQKIINRRAKTL